MDDAAVGQDLLSLLGEASKAESDIPMEIKEQIKQEITDEDIGSPTSLARPDGLHSGQSVPSHRRKRRPNSEVVRPARKNELDS